MVTNKNSKKLKILKQINIKTIINCNRNGNQHLNLRFQLYTYVKIQMRITIVWIKAELFIKQLNPLLTIF